METGQESAPSALSPGLPRFSTLNSIPLLPRLRGQLGRARPHLVQRISIVEPPVLHHVADRVLRDQRAAQRAKHDVNFGKAIATLRKEQGLRQSDIAGLSERQLRRIERGARAGVSALRSLAAAHDLDLNGYLNVVAEGG